MCLPAKHFCANVTLYTLMSSSFIHFHAGLMMMSADVGGNVFILFATVRTEGGDLIGAINAVEFVLGALVSPVLLLVAVSTRLTRDLSQRECDRLEFLEIVVIREVDSGGALAWLFINGNTCRMIFTATGQATWKRLSLLQG